MLYLSKDTELQAMFFIEDPLRDNLHEFLKKIESLGFKETVIISGDHQQSVTAIAKKLGIKKALGNLDPKQKLDWINKKHANNSQIKNKVLMLGDGINDAPVMAAADVSMTFSNATDLAKNNCDFLLLSQGFTHLYSAFKLMHKTRSIIKQNLGWAIVYNAIAIPAAALGFITPWMAAIGMSVSSLFVVLNSLRVK